MRILFATDGSRGAAVAEDFLLSLPLSSADDVTVVNAPVVSEREAYALLSRCRWRFASRDIPTSTVLRAGLAADVACAVALDRASELIVVGSRGLGTISGALMGSVARALARSGPAPVLVVRARRDAPRRVLLAIDGSADAYAAVELAARLPLPSEARFSLLHVLADTRDILAENPGVRDFGTTVALRDAHEREGLRVLAHGRELLGARVSDEDIVDRGHIGEQLLHRAIDSAADLIMLGARGQTLGTGLLNTSVADHVLSHAHCAVIVAKAALRPRIVDATNGPRAATTV